MNSKPLVLWVSALLVFIVVCTIIISGLFGPGGGQAVMTLLFAALVFSSPFWGTMLLVALLASYVLGGSSQPRKKEVSQPGDYFGVLVVIGTIIFLTWLYTSLR